MIWCCIRQYNRNVIYIGKYMVFCKLQVLKPIVLWSLYKSKIETYLLITNCIMCSLCETQFLILWLLIFVNWMLMTLRSYCNVCMLKTFWYTYLKSFVILVWFLDLRWARYSCANKKYYVICQIWQWLRVDTMKRCARHLFFYSKRVVQDF